MESSTPARTTKRARTPLAPSPIRRSHSSRSTRTPARCWRWWAAATTASRQLNHAVAQRPTGSIFKPFVYAAAFKTILNGTALARQIGVFTPVTMLNDEQTTYIDGRKDYTPGNFERGEFHGMVTAR